MVDALTPPDARLVTGRFLLVCGSTLAFFTAIGINIPVLPLFIERELHRSDIAVGFTVTALSLAAVVARPLLGLVARRFGQQRLMVAGGLLGAAGFGLCALVHSLPALIGLRIVAGLGDAALFVSAATLATEMAPRTRRAEAVSYLSVAVFGGLGIGPLIGQALQRHHHYSAAFISAAACAVMASLLATRVHQPAHLITNQGRMRIVHPAGVRTGLVLALVIVGFTGWSTFVPLRAAELNIGSGTFYALYSGIVLVIRLAGARLPERIGLARTSAAAVVISGSGLIVMAVVDGGGGLLLGTIVLSVGISLNYPSLMALTLNSVPDDERPAVVPTFTAFFEVGTAVGGLALGPVADHAGYQAAFATGGAAMFAGVVVLWFFVIVPRRIVLLAAHR